MNLISIKRWSSQMSQSGIPKWQQSKMLGFGDDYHVIRLCGQEGRVMVDTETLEVWRKIKNKGDTDGA